MVKIRKRSNVHEGKYMVDDNCSSFYFQLIVVRIGIEIYRLVCEVVIEMAMRITACVTK